MNFEEIYQSKKCTPEQAVSGIEDHSNIVTSSQPMALLKALFANKEKYSDLHLYAQLGFTPGPDEMATVFSPDAEGHISYDVSFIHMGEQKAKSAGRRIDHLVAHFSEVEAFFAERIKPAYYLGHVAPMDEEGFFSMGTIPGPARIAVDMGAKAIVQVNPHMPMMNTDYNKVHISEVEALVEVDKEIFDSPFIPPGDKEKTIAGYLVERIPNGATLQFGVGALPGAVGMFLENHRDLGIHTETFTYVSKSLMEKGVVNNSKKTIYPGQSIAAFADADRATFDFIHRNKDVLFKQMSWVNNPYNIAKNDNMISINSCLSVDLRGQVCSESLGTGVTGGSGGQLDFVRGARMSKGGQSYISMHSTVEKKDGTRISKIVMTLTEGSIVTVPRNDVMNIVTEYGIAELTHRSLKEKALALISIAHPDFRDELMFQAKKNGYLLY